MATILNPVMRIEIEGKRHLQNYFLREELEVAGKSEPWVDVSIDSAPEASGWVDVGLNGMKIVSRIVIEAPSLQTINNTLRIVKVDENNVESITDIVGIHGIQIVGFNDVEGSKVKKIQLKSDSVSEVRFDCRILSL